MAILDTDRFGRNRSSRYAIRGPRFLIQIAFLLILLIPLSSGIHPNEGEFTNEKDYHDNLYGENRSGTVVTYLQDSKISNAVGSISFRMFSGDADTRDSKESTWRIVWTNTKTMQQNSNGVWNFSLSVDSVPIPNCFFHIETFSAGGFLTNMITYPPYGLVCHLEPAPSFGYHYVNITRTILSGTPSVVSRSTTSIEIFRAEAVATSMTTTFEQVTGLTGLEFSLMIGAYFLLIFFWIQARLMGVQFLMIMGMIVNGIVWFLLWVELNLPVPMGFMLISLGTGIYMLTRWLGDMTTRPRVEV